MKVKSFKAKILLAFIALSFSMLIILALLLDNIFVKYIVSNIENQLVSTAKIARSEITDTREKKYEVSNELKSKLENIAKVTDSRITLIRRDGKVLADTESDVATIENHIGREEVRAAFNGRLGKAKRYSKTLQKQMIYVALPANNSFPYVVRVAVANSEIQQRLNQLLSGILLLLLIIAVFAIFFSEVISRSISKPVAEVLSIVRKISNENFEGRVKVDSRDEFGEIALSINEMIHKLKAGRLNLQKEKDKLAKTIENIPHGILLVDRKLNVLIHNRFFIEKIDIGGGLPQFIQKLIRKVIKSRENAFEDVTTEYPEKRRLKVSAAPILEAKTGINEVIVVVEDVTELYALENVRRDFVSNASHELKTPVSNLMLISENLKYALKNDPAKVDQFVDILEKESTRLSRLVNDLLDLSRLEKPLSKIEKIKLPVLIDETLADVKETVEKKNLEMIVSVATGLEIFGDKKQIQIAVMNLLENAVSYTPESGTIRLMAAEDNNLLEISVEDTGCGIHSRHLNRIFERFYRADMARSRQSGGTGLGLSIVKNTMELHRGSVRVESQVGVGSKFTLVFPLPEC